MRAIGCLVLTILIIFASGLLFGFAFIGRLFKILFGTGSSTNKTSSNHQRTKQPHKQHNSPTTKKIISREEGEYVDYEEIKDF